jgi:hypothetical protein
MTTNLEAVSAAPLHSTLPSVEPDDTRKAQVNSMRRMLATVTQAAVKMLEAVGNSQYKEFVLHNERHALHEALEELTKSIPLASMAQIHLEHGIASVCETLTSAALTMKVSELGKK